MSLEVCEKHDCVVVWDGRGFCRLCTAEEKIEALDKERDELESELDARKEELEELRGNP